MRTRSNRAKHCPVCHGPMRKHGRNRSSSQRWMCPSYSITSTMRRTDRARDFHLREFLDWLLTGRTQEQLGAGGARAFRKRAGWCWSIRPAIEPDGVVHHTVMADSTYMAHGWCLVIAIDGANSQAIDWQWCSHENSSAYTALFGRIPPTRRAHHRRASLRGEGLCRSMAVHAHPTLPGAYATQHHNTTTDLTLKPRLQAGRELKKLSDRLTRIHDTREAVRWGEALSTWHQR